MFNQQSIFPEYRARGDIAAFEFPELRHDHSPIARLLRLARITIRLWPTRVARDQLRVFVQEALSDGIGFCH